MLLFKTILMFCGVCVGRSENGTLKEQLLKQFTKLDTEKDGMLSKEEILGSVDPEQVEQLRELINLESLTDDARANFSTDYMKAFDTNPKDNWISQLEYLDAYPAVANVTLQWAKNNAVNLTKYYTDFLTSALKSWKQAG